jgi:6-phosphogluconate dehydrogenase (decarboxylating)
MTLRPATGSSVPYVDVGTSGGVWGGVWSEATA